MYSHGCWIPSENSFEVNWGRGLGSLGQQTVLTHKHPKDMRVPSLHQSNKPANIFFKHQSLCDAGIGKGMANSFDSQRSEDHAISFSASR